VPALGCGALRFLRPTAVEMTGSRNATVLPLPVCAHAMTSCPRRASGIVCFWMGVGTVYFMRLCPVKLRAAKGGRSGPNEPKSVREGTAVSVTAPALPPPPERVTGICSYCAKLMPDEDWAPNSAATAASLESRCQGGQRSRRRGKGKVSSPVLGALGDGVQRSLPRHASRPEVPGA
jgi:hypothetical protein